MSNDDVLAAQIKSSIITKIKTQEYLPGELLPSERWIDIFRNISCIDTN